VNLKPATSKTGSESRRQLDGSILLSRRTLLGTSGVAFGAAFLPGLRSGDAMAQTPAATPVVDELVIDLAGAPVSINPFVAYSARDWSIVHSIYDAPVGFAPDGSIQPLAAESFETADGKTFTVKLREALTFHDGTPVTAEAIQRAVTAMQNADSQAAGLFAGITSVKADGLTAIIECDTPSPWLPAQIATWLVLIPESWTPDNALTAPVGSGPFRFEAEEAGSSISLVRNEAYTWHSPKGEALAGKVTYRFVPEPGTRVADLTSGSAGIIVDLGADQTETVNDAGAQVITEPIVASAWIRIANDVAPFDDERVRQALNYAVDVESIAQALVSTESHRIASLFPDERALGFDASLKPYAYDPDKAKSLLSEAGVSEGQKLEFEVTSSASQDVAEAIAAQLGDVGFDVSIVSSELATFNGQWTEKSAPPLRLVTWGPLYEPQTLLSLVFASKGFLSRFSDAETDRLIEAGANETDPTKRASLYQQLASHLHDTAPAIFLWNQVDKYGVAADLTEWKPRGDSYVIATRTEQ